MYVEVYSKNTSIKAADKDALKQAKCSNNQRTEMWLSIISQYCDQLNYEKLKKIEDIVCYNHLHATTNRIGNDEMPQQSTTTPNSQHFNKNTLVVSLSRLLPQQIALGKRIILISNRTKTRTLHCQRIADSKANLIISITIHTAQQRERLRESSKSSRSGHRNTYNTTEAECDRTDAQQMLHIPFRRRRARLKLSAVSARCTYAKCTKCTRNADGKVFAVHLAPAAAYTT